jgi:hypothetical protein
MDMSKMTRQEIEVLLRLLAEWERQELALLMLQRRLAKQEGQLHDQPGTRFESLLPAIHSAGTTLLGELPMNGIKQIPIQVVTESLIS